MACRPGEENVATLFGDVHYFYGAPTEDPPHHRFEKGSYVYLFENAAEGRARIEIANRPGTDDLDAFDGFLDSTNVRYSYKQQCVVGITVGQVSDMEQWHLPWFDPRNETKYHYKLHSLDIYFWTPQDALQFVNGIRRVLPPAQVDVQDEPGPPPRQQLPQAHDASGLVQKLESAAISSEKAPERASSGSGGAPSFAAPPLSAVSAGATENAGSPLPPPPPPPQSFAPMAYNPAAPAAPEAIKHREKTPPPPDGGIHPLHQTIAYDASTPFSPGLAPSGMAGPLSPAIPPPQYGHVPGAPTFPGPPSMPPPPPGVASPGLPPVGFGSHPGLARAQTLPVASSPYGATFPGSPGFAPPQPFPGLQQQQPQHQQNPTPPAAPGTPGLPPPPPAQAQTAPPVTGGGALGMTAMDYSIHQQAYRPDDGEMEHRYKQKSDRETRKLESNAYKLEKGVTSMFKKFEKKFG
ncbi:hypothetical protein GGTG_01627 [Gaeumannomyces tritici R3-111a-1]|uniref:RNA recognition motif-containing protein n=1 Tax=Gaeumannomyces tritici (strain R3-111a-1) TaxID=644352 RepID=J3NK45_GAET3|nr:hypothetical protein GGTG_01627 [Gaeumannomyces tritici R3-111a-1]EJT81649.1 hypothetical protein GGTG_01627 [Gaeumannomyces tritici R3-111a-1]